MTDRQRQSLVDLTTTILSIPSAPPDIRFRAENLRMRLLDPFAGLFGRLWGR